MSKEERVEMIKFITETPDSEDEEEKNVLIEEPIEETEEPVNLEVTHKIEKFKQTFYKINGRYPTEKEITDTLSTFLSDTKVELTNINSDSENEGGTAV
jgi:hypothetical protein